MDINQDDRMEQLDESFNKISIDCKEENSLEESSSDHAEMDTSCLAADNDYDKPAGCLLAPWVARKRFKNDITSYRLALRRKEEIKDIAKDKILPFLPAKSLIRFRSVSKEWDQWIKSPLFALHQSYSFRDLSGFFCQYDNWKLFVTLNHPAYGVPYYICNPATEEWKKLPEPEYYHGFEPAIVLAFEPSLLNINANYHVICAVRLLDQPVVCFEVYSSETQSWRQSSTMCLELGSHSFTGNGFYMKGVVYWEISRKKVLAFDFKNDNYEIMPLPFGSPLGGVLTQMHEELCYIGISDCLGNQYTIKIYGGMDLSLRQSMDLNIGSVSDDIKGYGEMDLSLRQSMDFNIGSVSDDIKGYRVLSCVDNGIVIFLVGSFIYAYSLSDQRLELVSREGVDNLAARYLPYVNSLVCVA